MTILLQFDKCKKWVVYEWWLFLHITSVPKTLNTGQLQAKVKSLRRSLNCDCEEIPNICDMFPISLHLFFTVSSLRLSFNLYLFPDSFLPHSLLGHWKLGNLKSWLSSYPRDHNHFHTFKYYLYIHNYQAAFPTQILSIQMQVQPLCLTV